MTWPPGWHPDPTARFEFRYYNGQRWTSDVSVDGQRFVDHLESSEAPGGGQPGWAPARESERGSSRTFAVASFWVAFGAFLCGWIPFIFVIAIGGAAVAFIFGVMALRRERRHPARGRGYAIAGIVMAVAALGSSTVGFLLTRTVMREVNAFLGAGPNSVAIDSCETTNGLTVFEGSITNEDTRRHAYTVSVSYRSNDVVADSDEIAVPSVAPGETAKFRATGFADATDVECRIDAVRGPQPFTITP
ncbi:MAG: DUF4190 domain-containing protein [Ilumatobacteraceae bacterium]|nr:DUF4190 domain-containing protein [Ilumatobacteraceae bacterium]